MRARSCAPPPERVTCCLLIASRLSPLASSRLGSSAAYNPPMLPEPGEEFLLPLFPLPNVVFFPRTRLPLHVFEPRYRQMVADAMAGDERIGMILLESGWESNYYGAPSVHPVGTCGQIESLVALEDGRYNLILNGEARF